MNSKKMAVLWLCILILFSLIVIVVDIPQPVKAGTIWVDDDYVIEDPTHKKTIQAAVDNATPGDTVFVFNGTYYENVVVNKTINLTGEDTENTIIDGDGTEDVVHISANWVNITGLTIVNSGSLGFPDHDAGIDIGSYYNNVSNNHIISNYYGIVIGTSVSNIIHRNNISRNQYGIRVSSSSDNFILLNNITSNNNDGIWNEFSDTTISSNNILNNSVGIWLFKSNGNNVTCNNVSSNKGNGIFLSSSSNNNISNNKVTSNDGYGIDIGVSSNNNLTNNTFIDDGIFIHGNNPSDYNSHNIPTNNIVNGKPLYYYKDCNGIIINELYVGELILANCTDVIVKNLHINNTDVGIEIAFSTNITITNSTISTNFYGIYLDWSLNNNITYNNVSNNKDGIYVQRSNNNEIAGNTVSSNTGSGIFLFSSSLNNNIISNNVSSNSGNGIIFAWSSKNTIVRNDISSNNIYGISIISSSDNTITNNNISLNNWYGFHLESSSNNEIYHNNIIDNTNQASDDSSNNYWDNGYPSGGNYWSNYGGMDNYKGPNQDIPGMDGIGDIPYTNIWGGAGAQDNYPLETPYKPLENYTILKQGWNLISIPLIQEELNLTRVLGSIDGWYDAVQFYNITDINDPWKHNILGKPFGNDLRKLNESIGFWIHITQPGDTIFVYNGNQPTVNQTISLFPGWNLVGYPSLSNKNRTNALNNIDFGSDVDAIWTHNATTQKWKEITASDNFEVGRGYWIHSKVTKTWIVPL